MKHRPFVAAALLAFASMVPANADDSATERGSLTLQSARMNENPITLKRLLNHPAHDRVEHALSAAFLKSRSLPVAAAPLSLEQWIEAHPDAAPEAKAFAYGQLGDRYMAVTQYKKAAMALRQAQAFSMGPADSDLNDQAVLAELAASVPPIERGGTAGASVALEQDLAKLRRAPVQIAGVSNPMIVDTGAEISVVAQSVAEKSRMRFLDGEVTVGTTTDNVSGRLAVSNDVNIGGMTFENVLFLVLPDEQLTFADGQYFVDGIIGLPLFTAARRMAWQDGATRLLLGDAAMMESGTSVPLYWHDGGLGLEVTYQQAAFPAFFDSGASRSSGSPLFKSLLSQQDQNTLLAQDDTRTGVGGTKNTRNYILPSAVLGIGGELIPLKDFKIAGEQLDYPGGDIGIIGSDILARARSFSVDFARMTYQMDLAESGTP